MWEWSVHWIRFLMIRKGWDVLDAPEGRMLGLLGPLFPALEGALDWKQENL